LRSKAQHKLYQAGLSRPKTVRDYVVTIRARNAHFSHRLNFCDLPSGVIAKASAKLSPPETSARPAATAEIGGAVRSQPAPNFRPRCRFWLQSVDHVNDTVDERDDLDRVWATRELLQPHDERRAKYGLDREAVVTG
jgi:hypothetical protein